MRDDGVARAHRHKGGQHRADVGDDNSHPQQTGGVGAQLGNRGGDKADNDEGSQAELAGGLILMGMGCKILIEHTLLA